MNVQRDWTSTICPWNRCLRLLCFCICFVLFGICMAWHCFALFCLQIWNYNVNGLEFEKIEKWTNGKRNSGGLHAARQRCFVLITELEERKKIYNPLQSTARTYTQVSAQQRNEHNFQLIKIHLRTMLENNWTCFQATVVIQANWTVYPDSVCLLTVYSLKVDYLVISDANLTSCSTVMQKTCSQRVLEKCKCLKIWFFMSGFSWNDTIETPTNIYTRIRTHVKLRNNENGSNNEPI